MLDLILEGIRAAILAGITVFIWHTGRRRFESISNGWPLVLGGFALVTFGSLIDITDNVAGLDRFVVIGDTPAQAFLEIVVGYLGGFVCLAVGLHRWLPRVGRLAEESEARGRAEEELRTSRDLARIAFDSGGNEIFVTDEHGGFVRVNKAFCDLLGYSETELLGKTTLDITHPDDMETTRRRATAILGGETSSYTSENRFVRKDGETVWAFSNVSTISNADGSLRHVVGNIQDITGRRREQEALRDSEERFRTIFQAAGVCTVLTDANGIYLDVNQAYADFLGYSREELIGISNYKLMPPDELPALVD
jgi:PAS domain S-box-containing protein